MKRALSTALVVSLFAVVGAAAQRSRKIVVEQPGRVVYQASYDQVWAALMESLATMNVTPQAADKDSGTVFLNVDGAWAAYWGGVNNMIATMTTKKVSRWSTWQAIATKGNFYCKAVSAGQTEVRATFQFSGYNGWSRQWEPVDSNGWLEARLLGIISEKLPEPPILPDKPGDEKVIAAVEVMLLAMRKVDATYKLEASEELLMNALTEAQARMDEFSDSAHTAVVPKIAGLATDAMAAFRSARNPQTREADLVLARSAVKTAAEFLGGYRKFTTEISLAAAPAAEMVRPQLAPVAIGLPEAVLEIETPRAEVGDLAQLFLLAKEELRIVAVVDGGQTIDEKLPATASKVLRFRDRILLWANLEAVEFSIHPADATDLVALHTHKKRSGLAGNAVRITLTTAPTPNR